jgi:DNA-binding GntR family transcriptional regulator
MDQPETVVEYAISALREAIRDGRLAQGQRLVVADVTKMLGVSNGPVREAIRRLTGEGLVAIAPHRGASVRELTSRDVREIFEIREVLEGLAARLAAKHIATRDYRRRLEATVEDMRRAVEDGPKYVTHNQNFHELICEMAENERVREQSRQLTLPIYRFRYHYLMDPSYARTSAAEHDRIAEAILDGDEVRAERFMRSHVRNSGAAMLQALEANKPAHDRRFNRASS